MRAAASPHLTIRRAAQVFATLILLAGALAPAAEAQSGPGEGPFFARSYKIVSLRADPWLGGLWLGTEGGLFFRDVEGGTARHYSISTGLPHPNVNDVAVSAREVWVATPFGVAVLDKATDKFRTLEVAGGPFLANTRTLFLDESEAWIGTGGAGLFRANYETYSATQVTNPETGDQFGPVWGIGAIGSDLYVSGPGWGLVRWDRETGDSSSQNFTYLQKNPQYLKLLATPQDVWIGTDGDGVVRYYPNNGTLTEYASAKTTNALSVFEPVEVGSQVWLPAVGGVSRYDRATKEWRSWGGANAGGVNANALAHYGGTLYAATSAGDIARFDPSSQTWSSTGWWTFSRQVAYNVVNSCQVEQGRLLFGTGGGGATYYDPANGRWTVVGSESGGRNEFPDIGVFATASDSQTIFFGIGRGVVERDRATGAFLAYRTDGLENRAQEGFNFVKDIVLDGADAWFANEASKQLKRANTDPDRWNPGGVTHMDRATRTMLVYGKDAGLTDANVTTLALDGDLVWVGMHTGLDTIHTETRAIRHVRQGPVADIVASGDGVWVAAFADGLLHVDPSTMTESRFPLPGDAPAHNLLEHNGTLWVGTAYHGLYAFDLATHAFERFSSGQPRDYIARCMVVHDGILYMGTEWGVERFDLALKRFLPQIGTSTAASQGADGSMIGIGLPAPDAVIPVGAPVATSGIASAPGGSTVQVRLGEGAWITATGVEDWTAALIPPEGLTGPIVLSARVESAGKALVQAARTINIGAAEDPATAAARAGIRHVPLLDVYVGEPLRFRVDGAQDLPGVRASVQLSRPGGVVETVVFVRASDGGLVAETTPMSTAGTAHYSVLVQWDGGSALLPPTAAGFGREYGMLVRPITNQAKAFFAGETSFAVPTGTPTKIEVLVQNTGTRLSSFNLSWSGSTAGWVTSVPSAIVLAPASSQDISIGILVPEGQKPGRYALDLRLAPPANEGAASATRIDLLVGGVGPAEEDDAKGLPLPLWLPLAALAAAILVARRRG